MIYTITLSPAIDYKLTVKEYIFNRTIHATQTYLEAGGKGINVSLVLNQLGVENVALITAGGITRKLFLDLLGGNLPNKVIFNTNHNVRINIKGRSNTKALEINAKTQPFSKGTKTQLIQFLSKKLKPYDYVIFSGRPPTGLSSTIFADLLVNTHIPLNIIVDAKKEFVIPLLKRGIFLLKPNIQELEDYVNAKNLQNNKQLIDATAKKLLERQVKNVLISMDSQGSIIYSKGFSEYCEGKKGLNIIDATGAGDSMVAGFLAAHIQGKNTSTCHKWAIASALATITSTSLATKSAFDYWLENI